MCVFNRRKKYIYTREKELCGKKKSKYILYTLEKLICFGCFGIEDKRDNDNETGLEEGRRNRNRNLQCFHFLYFTFWRHGTITSSKSSSHSSTCRSQ